MTATPVTREQIEVLRAECDAIGELNTACHLENWDQFTLMWLHSRDGKPFMDFAQNAINLAPFLCSHVLELQEALDTERRISVELNRQLREWEDRLATGELRMMVKSLSATAPDDTQCYFG